LNNVVYKNKTARGKEPARGNNLGNGNGKGAMIYGGMVMETKHESGLRLMESYEMAEKAIYINNETIHAMHNTHNAQYRASYDKLPLVR
jgi:hypothetical protein